MSKDKKLAQVLHFDLQGKRDFKYDFLNENSLASIAWNKLEPKAPNYFLVKKDFDESGVYEKGFKMDELFVLNSVGFVTSKDAFLIDFKSEKLIEKQIDIYNIDLSNQEFNDIYKLESKYFNVIDARKKAILEKSSVIINFFYRPMDVRYILYEKHFLERNRFNVLKHIIKKENFALVCSKQSTRKEIDNIQIVNSPIELKFNSHDRNSNIFPLYLYPDNNKQQTIDQSNDRKPNLNIEIVNEIAKKIGLTFTIEKETTKATFAPIDILDYIYAVLHSPNYREKYKEFLKIDFPRVPYPIDANTFWQLVALGSEIRQIHLLESPTVEKYITQYPIDGDNVVTKPKYENGKVFINDTQYFDNVPEVAWTFFIGGYQPAQKWLKDRKERTLEFDDILHYQKIIVALTQTDKLMTKINGIDIEAK
ncbi:MAG: hypothetical protein HOO89_02520 [Ferruginibacter sp.]|nr:hypothetical protein [Ferruginibacter sp.]